MLLLAAMPWLRGLASGPQSLLASAPEQIVFPAQTLLCGVLLALFWRHYGLGSPRKIVFTMAAAILIFAIWISPQAFFRAAPREVGFNPTIFSENPPLFAAMLALRFLRLVVVVPLLEEIFWRGFLLRDLIDRDFQKIPVGTFSLFSYSVVTLLFAFAHWGGETFHPGPDFVPALFAGALFNFVAWRTRSLTSCVAAHALTNLLLGVYILQTRQWGFW